ncbi:ABC transporter ATP-binding protein [Patulibacter defluvii]|uniref:ABC transporter ATP-binding protein n=1 Tax=Patulibacter defluvii TaxID=3095358 RepID=UPI002A75403A|nr:ATP-binding cassette domain-containing protein [Patulibacter sp. DM4]
MSDPTSRDGSADPAPALSARGVVRRRGPLPVLDGIDLRVAPHELVALVGPSGCGKSTLLELVCGLQAPDGGTLRARPAALMPQRDLLLPWLDARDNVGLPLRLAGRDRRAARAAAGELLERVGLERFARSRPDQLSGGMRQRVSFLRALATERELLCLDEPFGALDAITREELRRWLAARLRERPRSVLLVTHDVEEAALLGDRVVVLGPRPARVVAEVAVDAGPALEREPTDPPVVAARREIHAALHAAIAAGRAAEAKAGPA